MRKGFTLLELIVVIAIITVLGGITLLGVRHIMGNMKETETRAALQAAFHLYKVVWINGNAAPGFWYENGVAGVYARPNYPPPYGAFWKLISCDRPTYTTLDDLSNPDLADDLMANTIVAYAHMEQFPECRKAIGALPANRIREYSLPYSFTFTNPITAATTTTTGTLTAHVPLDAWGNPILFVPASGYTRGPGNPIMTSLGLKPYDPAQWPPAQFLLPQWPPKAAELFFISAGPDGKLWTTEDNLISRDN
jgi:prepilin-type N-terminal cleavage/methylation domain-containing protein